MTPYNFHFPLVLFIIPGGLYFDMPKTNVFMINVCGHLPNPRNIHKQGFLYGKL